MTADRDIWDEATLASAQAGLMQLLSGYAYSWVVHVAARLKLADHLADGPLAAAQIAERCAADVGSTRRLLTALVALGVVAESPEGHFSATPMARWLRSDVDGSLRPLALLSGERSLWEAWARSHEAVQSGRAAFDLAHGSRFFEALDGQDEVLRLFHAAGRGTREWNRAMADACDFSGVRRIVDVGGGDGAFVEAILERQPELMAEVFERPAVIETLRTAGQQLRPWTWTPGDFFEGVPSGADVYVLRRILHDWDDADALRILETCRRAMPERGRLLILEYLRGGVSTALLDFTLLVLTGGTERTEPEYRRLLEAAGLRLERVTPTRVGMSILQASRRE